MREKAERLNSAAARWERGAEGERLTALALAELPADQWTTFHDVPWPGRQRANLDHVVVGPSGVFVIDSKNWAGKVEVRDGVLRQSGRRREREALAVRDAAAAVARIAPLVRPDHVHPVMCFSGGPSVSGSAHGVTLCSTADLVTALQLFPGVFVETERADVARHLGEWFSGKASMPPGETRAPRRAARPVLVAVRGPRPARQRTKAKRSAGSSLVGIVAAVAVLGVAFARPGIFQDFSDAFTGLVASHHEGVDEWTCRYAPTTNHNWHDDVLCTKGAKQDRPHLLPNDKQVTEVEIKQAAEKYERKLDR